MEVVPPVGMLVYTAVYTLAATRHMHVYSAVYMLAGDGAVFETYQKRTTLISEWGRVARYHSCLLYTSPSPRD